MLVWWHRGVGAGPVGAGASSSTEGGLEGLPGSGASSCPTRTKPGGPQGRWERGDPLPSPWCSQWALSSPINRLPGVRGIELPDLCPARPAPSASLLGFVGPRPGRLLAPDSPSGCRGDRFRLGHSRSSRPSLPHTLTRALAAPSPPPGWPSPRAVTVLSKARALASPGSPEVE